MAFERQPRFYVLRCHFEAVIIYLNQQGKETRLSRQFGVPCSNGEPGEFTIDQATKLISPLNDELKKQVVTIGNKPYGLDGFPRMLWHTEPVI